MGSEMCIRDRYLFIYLLHVTREVHSVKLICRNLYAIFSHVKKSLYNQSEWCTAVFTSTINDNVKAFASQSESCIVYIQIAFQILAALLSVPPSKFPAKAEESSRLVPVGCCPDVFVWHQENKNTSSKSQRDVSLLKKE